MFLMKKYITSELNTSHGKMSEFVSVSLLVFILVIKQRIFDFESHFIKNHVNFQYVLPVSVSFGLSFIV